MIPRDDPESGDDRGDEAPGVADLATGVVRTSWPWILGALAAVVAAALLLWGANRPDDPSLPPVNADGPPTTPADGLNFTEVARMIGESCWRMLIADTPEERSSGLRYRESELDQVDGMLFVHEAPQEQPGFFTMAGVVEGLAVGFYDASGVRTGGHEMEPCRGNIAGCPQYDAPVGWQYAIETKPGKLPEGNLGAECTPPPPSPT
ncbi:MAG TPA: DUF192 domain-containing protein [Acidimicrobiia bacterium]|nr:DUF192 domain-containing protein [Acidimicrobiia bacterium]